MPNQPYSYISLDEDLDLSEGKTTPKADSPVDELAKMRVSEGSLRDGREVTREMTAETDDFATNSGSRMSDHFEMNRDRAEAESLKKETSEPEMASLEEKMLKVAVEDYNTQRQKAHAEIDRVYDNMIEITGQKIKGLTKDVAVEAGME